MMVLGFQTNGASSSAAFTIAGSNTSINQVYNGKITLLAPTTEITGTSTSFASGVLKVVNTNTTSSNIVSLMNPNLLSLSTTTLTLGKVALANEAVEFTYTHNTTTSLRSSSWGFYGAINPNIAIYPSQITLFKDTNVTGTLSCTGSIFSNSSGLSNTSALNPGIFVYNDIVNSYGMDEGYNPTTLRYRTRVFCPAYAGADITLSGRSSGATTQSDFTDHLIVNGVTGATTINGNLTAVNLKNATRMWFATADVPASNNQWTPLDFLFVTREKGNQGIDWINQATGFRNTSPRSLMITCSFSCQRTFNTLGVTAIRFFVNNTFSLGTQDVSGLDAISISGTTYLDPNDTIACQIYQTSGSIVNYNQIVVNISSTTFYE
jgi:hypothetical protein